MSLMFGKWFGMPAVVAMVALGACSSGGSGVGVGNGPYGGPPPTTPPQSNVPIQQTVAGKAAFVNPSNKRTLYFLDVDTSTGGKCTGGCLSVWIPIVPSAGSSGQNGFTIVTRSDGTSMQWDYQSHPLYMYSGDSGPDQSNGDGIPFAGGHWHVARPAN
jgi:predicted lipoprotein with Yx(FWY)xxD motif